MATTTALVATAAAAQAPTPPFTLAAYYRCDYVRQTRADTLYRQVYSPALDRQIKAGRLTAYGFSSHRIGGAWRRLESMTAPTLEQLIAAQDAMQEDVARTNPKGAAEFDAICGSHDDYIWQRVLGSPAPATTPAYGYSRYLVCDLSREAEADMIMATAFAPIMNKHLAAGHIASWGWLTHNMGGPVRRVLNWSGPDVMAVLNAEDVIVTDMANHPMDAAFNAACSGHSDYVWHSEVSGR
jgi:hypothetical protein